MNFWVLLFFLKYFSLHFFSLDRLGFELLSRISASIFKAFCFDSKLKVDRIQKSSLFQMDNDRELTFTTLSGAANSGEQTFIVEQPVSFQVFLQHIFL